MELLAAARDLQVAAGGRTGGAKVLGMYWHIVVENWIGARIWTLKGAACWMMEWQF